MLAVTTTPHKHKAFLNLWDDRWLGLTKPALLFMVMRVVHKIRGHLQQWCTLFSGGAGPGSAGFSRRRLFHRLLGSLRFFRRRFFWHTQRNKSYVRKEYQKNYFLPTAIQVGPDKSMRAIICDCGKSKTVGRTAH